MIKIHNENIVPLLLPLPKWTDDTKSESIEKGDLIYMMKRERITFVPCYTHAIVEETHTSLDKMERTLTVRYVGAELLRREETKDDNDWPPQSKKKSEEVSESDMIKVHLHLVIHVLLSNKQIQVLINWKEH